MGRSPSALGAGAFLRRPEPILAEAAPASWSVLAGQGLFLLALILSVALRGAVTPVTLLSTVGLLGVALLLGALAELPEGRTLRSLRLSLAVAAGLALYLLFQAWKFEGNPFGNPLWEAAAPLGGRGAAAISVAPAMTREALITLLAPFLFYAAGLVLFRGDQGGMRLMRWVAGLGGVFALFGLVQLAFLPDRLLLVQKTAYLDSLTSFFVNRNTAGTLLGVASLAALTLAICPANRRGTRYALLGRLVDPDVPTDRKVRLGARLAGLFLILFALFLTRSRGALLATTIVYIGVLAALALQAAGRWVPRPGRESRAAAALHHPLSKVAGVTLGVILIVILFGGLAIERMETRGIDEVRLCIYRSTLEAIGQNWRFGTGFGTFEAIFPLYRSADCGGPQDVFLRGHNFYLEGLLGLGVGFVPVLIGALVHIVGNFYRGLRRRRRMRPVAIIALGAVALVALHGLVDFSLQIPGMAAFFATYLAAATTISLGPAGPKPGAPRRSPKRRSPPPDPQDRGAGSVSRADAGPAGSGQKEVRVIDEA